MSTHRKAVIGLTQHRELFAALRSLFGTIEQVSPAPEPAPILDAQTLAELADIADRVRRLEARIVRKGAHE